MPSASSEAAFNSPLLADRQLEGLGIAIERHYFAPSDVVFSALPAHLITWNLGKPGNLLSLEQGLAQKAVMRSGGATLTPAGQSRHWCWDHNAEVLQLQLQPQLIAQIAIASEIDINQVELINQVGIDDSQMASIGRSLLAELQSNGLAGRLYVESLVNLLVIHLFRKYSGLNSGLARSLPPEPSQVSPSRLKQVIEYIHDHVEQNLSLVDLASLANLSPSRFSRVFRQETGVSPHQYLIQIRIEQAKHLLRSGSETSIGQVARQVGFSDQSHFTRHFKRIVGVTPKIVLQDSQNILNRSINMQD